MEQTGKVKSSLKWHIKRRENNYNCRLFSPWIINPSSHTLHMSMPLSHDSEVQNTQGDVFVITSIWILPKTMEKALWIEVRIQNKFFAANWLWDHECKKWSVIWKICFVEYLACSVCWNFRETRDILVLLSVISCSTRTAKF